MDKQLIANDLLPVYQTTDTGEKVVDARELCGFLNVGRDFSNWIKDRIQKYGFIEGEDFSPVLAKTSEIGGRPRTDYILKLDMAKELAMVENNEMGQKARRYFIEVEKRYHARVPLAQTTEYDQVTKLLQMIRMGERDHLFHESTSRALRMQVAEMVLGHSIATPAPTPEEEPEIRPKSERLPDKRPQWVKDGFSAKTIGLMVGLSATKVGIEAKKLGLQHSEFGGWYEYMRSGKTCKVFIYNEYGKDVLLDNIDPRRLGSS